MLSLLVLSFLLGVAHAEINGYVTCDDVVWFFADGKQLAYQGGWNSAAKVSFPDHTEVLAIECQDNAAQGGIKAWFDNGIKTDSSWRCTNTYHLGWSGPGFDDSGIDWEQATVISDPTLLDTWHTAPTQLNGMASWIWTTGYRFEERKVYCRRRLHGGLDHQFNGLATCDDRMSFFCDDVQVAYSNSWPTSTAVVCPWNTEVLAIACRDVGGQGGIKASFSNGIETDRTWKCTIEHDEDWTKSDFDDSAWDDAVIVNDEITLRNWGDRPDNMDGYGEWIWTDGYKGQNRIVYCRKKITPGAAPAPLPAGTCGPWQSSGGTSGSGNNNGGSCNVDTSGLLDDIRSAITESTNSIESKTGDGFKALDEKLDTMGSSKNDKIDKIVNALQCTCPARRR